MSSSPATGPVLALDGVSPVASAAVARGGELLAVARRAEARSSTILLSLVAEVLRTAGVAPAELAGIAAAAGPGSFTGSRVTLSTALGVRLGTRAPAIAVSNLEALALAAGPGAGVLLAAVDALRGAWFVQRFARAEGAPPLESPRRLEPDAPPETGLGAVVGFGLEALAAERIPGAARETPEELASAIALAAAGGRWAWEGDALLRPIYLAPPNVRRAAP